MTLAKCNKHDETLPGPWPSRLDLLLHGTTNSVGDTHVASGLSDMIYQWASAGRVVEDAGRRCARATSAVTTASTCLVR